MVFNVYYLEKGAAMSSPCIILERDFSGEMMTHPMSIFYVFESYHLSS